MPPKLRMNGKKTAAELINCTLGQNILGSYLCHKDTGHSSTQARDRKTEASWGKGEEGLIVNKNSKADPIGNFEPVSFKVTLVSFIKTISSS